MWYLGVVKLLILYCIYVGVFAANLKSWLSKMLLQDTGE